MTVQITQESRKLYRFINKRKLSTGSLKAISEIENTSLFQQKKSKINTRKVAEELFLEMKGDKEINVSQLKKLVKTQI